MSVHLTHKKSDIEKRLRMLNTQLYGKKEKLDVRSSLREASEKMDKEVRTLKLEENQTSNIQLHNPSSNLQHTISTSDTTFLRHDLTKIAILSSLAVGVQLLLYFGSRLNVLRLF